MRQSGSKHRWYERASNLALAAVCVSAGSMLGCARLQPFRVATTEPAPIPASMPKPEAGHADETPALGLGLAAEDDYVVRVVSGTVTCSGTLIGDDQVLTAHHCVTQRGNFGDILARDVRASGVRVELGGDYMPWAEVAVRAIVAPSCGYSAGEGDLAILVLEKKLKDVPILKPRLDAAPAVGEDIEPIGFGRCALSSDGIRRVARQGGTVEGLGSGRFRLEAAICPGDSGGPGVSRQKGDIVGVISASVMDGSEQTRGLSEFTRLDRWRSLFSNAKLVSEGVTSSELPPVDCAEPTAKPAKKPKD